VGEHNAVVVAVTIGTGHVHIEARALSHDIQYKSATLGSRLKSNINHGSKVRACLCVGTLCILMSLHRSHGKILWICSER
jgi:hypothetical protein